MLCTGAWAQTTTSWPSSINQGKMYTLTSPSRGGITINSGKTQLAGTQENTTKSDDSHATHFAFVKSGEDYYLYSIAAAKYVNLSTSKGSLEESPAHAVHFTSEQSDKRVLLYYDTNHYINLGNDGSYHQVTIDTWKTADDGNKFKIEAVGDFTQNITIVYRQGQSDSWQKTFNNVVVGTVLNITNYTDKTDEYENFAFTTANPTVGVGASNNTFYVSCAPKSTQYTISCSTENGGVVYNGTNYINGQQLPEGADINTLTEIPVSGYHATISVNQSTHTITVTYAEDYPVNFDKSNAIPTSNRKIKEVTLAGITLNFTDNNGTTYCDHTSKTFTIPYTESKIKATITLNGGNWVHGYIYIDLNQDKEFKIADSEEVDYSTNQSTSPDLTQESAWSGFNCPAIGTYRMRIKTDWANHDPGGSSMITREAGSSGASGQIIDVMLHVVDPLEGTREIALGKVAELENVSALFPATEVAETKSAITNATTVEEINTALHDFCHIANGKKFTASSDVYNNGTYYLQASYLNGNLTTSTTMNRATVFEIEHEAGKANEYKIKALKIDTYLNETHTGATASIFNIIVTENENKVALRFNGSNNGIHHQNNGHVPVSYSYTSGGSIWLLTAVTDEEYEAMASTVRYTLTDVAGTEYTFIEDGAQGEAPVLTGVEGYNLSGITYGESEEEGVRYYYNATLNFPFNVSNGTDTRRTYISSYNGSLYWKAEASSISVNKGVLPKDQNHSSYEWAIIPSFNAGAFTFKIKSGDKYIYSNTTSNSTSASALSLQTDYSSPLTYDSHGFKFVNTGKYISSLSNATGNLSVYDSHDGTKAYFHELEDFDALKEQATTTYNSYEALTGEGLGKYSTNESYNAAMVAISDYVDGYADPLTAPEIRTVISNYLNSLVINQPERGKFYRFRTGAEEYNNHYLTNYALTDRLTLGTSSSTNNEAAVIWYLDESGKLVSFLNGTYINGTNITDAAHQSDGKVVVFGDGAKAASSAKVLGTYWINTSGDSNGSATTLLGWNYGDRKSLYNSNASDRRCQWAIEEVETIPVTIPASGYTTFYSPVSLTLPDGLEAYIAVLNEETASVLYRSVDEIPANTGVFLHGTPSVQYNIPTNGTTDHVDSDLMGHAYTQAYDKTANTVAGESLGNKHVYTLQSGTFKYYTGTKLSGFKAHYELQDGRETGNVRQYTFKFGEEAPTGIAEIEGMINADASIFDLSGRRLDKVARGINIVAGKKVIR